MDPAVIRANPAILKTRFAERQKLVDELRELAQGAAGRDYTPDEQATEQRSVSKLDQLDAEIAKGLEALERDHRGDDALKRFEAITRPRNASVFSERGLYPGPGSLLPNQAGMVELYDAFRTRQAVRVEADLESRALVTTTQSGKPTTYLGGQGAPVPLRIADIVGLPVDTQGPWGATTAFPVLGAGTAGIAAEGAAKSEYSAVTAGAVAPSVINAWTDITSQVQSLSSFVTKLQNKLARMIAVRENQLLRDTVNGTAGIGAQAFTAGDQSIQILRAASTIEAGVGVRPDLLIYNPADTALIFGTAVSQAFPSEIAELSMRVFGMTALPMTAQTAGFAMVGAWAAASRLVRALGLTYVTDPFTQMKSNVVTVLAEEAVGLAVEEPAGFTNVDIITP